ncbi:MAG: DUF885 domain-containing protein, partial [Proteobacteria bacterium]|nr:DUF885 domain-containing protein [Pseudomonadota bacterium]
MAALTDGIRLRFAEYTAFFVLLGCVPVAHAQSDADSAFESVAAAFVNDLPALSPVSATLSGDHRQDDILDQVDSDGRAATVRLYEKHLAALQSIEWQALSRANQVDADLLRNEIESRLWQLESLQEWAWNPLIYVDRSGSAIYGLMARDFAPLPERLVSAASRLEQMPRFLAQARAALQPQRVPKIHAETAVQQNPGLDSIIETMIVPHMGTATGEFKFRLQAAIATARNAVAEHQAWLEEELLPKAAGNFRIGAALFDSKLGFTLNSPLSRRDIRTRAENEYVAVRDQMYQISKGLYAEEYPFTNFPDNPDEAYKQVIIRTALEKAYQQLPEPDGIVTVAKEYLQQATDFVQERNLVTVPDDPIEIIVMPEFRRGVTLAYLDPPGPLDKGQKSFYAVAPLPSDWSDEQVNSFLREYNLLSIQALTVHEAMPGHHLQLALSNRYPSILRSVLWSGPFVEGWAVYAERLMVDEGYLDNDPLMRLINLKWYLRAVTNAIIDQAIHVDGMSRDAAMKLMIEGGFQEEREAAGKWVRAQLTATQLSTYFVGYQEHIDMRTAVE